LGEPDDSREERRLIALQAVRVAATVPVLVHRADGVGHAIGEPDHAGDLRAAFAPDGEDPLAAAARSEHRETAEAAQLTDKCTPPADVLPGVGELCRQAAPVAQPDRALHFLIGAAKEVEDHRGVARAARVLQEQRIQELRLLGRRQPQRFSDSKSYEAASGGMSARMPLRQVERVRQALEDAGQPRPVRPDAVGWRRSGRGAPARRVAH
jgi:hypothetical protein